MTMYILKSKCEFNSISDRARISCLHNKTNILHIAPREEEFCLCNIFRKNGIVCLLINNLFQNCKQNNEI